MAADDQVSGRGLGTAGDPDGVAVALSLVISLVPEICHVSRLPMMVQ